MPERFWSRSARVASVFVPAALALVFVTLMRGLGPEPDQWRVWWGEGSAVHDAAAALSFEDGANYLATRALRFAAMASGLDFPQLAFVPWLLLSLVLGGLALVRVGGRRVSAAWIVVCALALFSPRFGASLFVFERFRYVLPLLLALLAAWLLLRGRRYLPGLFAAWCVCAFAVFTSSAGALHWLGLTPLLVMRARRFEASAVTAVALWWTSMQGLVHLCHDRYLDGAGLLPAFASDPAAAWNTLASVFASTLPDIAPEHAAVRVVVGSLLPLCLALLAFWAARRKRGDVVVWLSLAAVGLASCVAVAHHFLPHHLNGATQKEALHAGLLLPFGLGAALACLLPRAARDRHLFLAGLLAVLCAQDCERGLPSAIFEAEMLRKSEALLVLADSGEDLYAGEQPRPSVELAADRESLRRRGMLRRLAPRPELGATAAALESERSHGTIDAIEGLRVAGTVADWGQIVCVVRVRAAARELVQVVAPLGVGGGAAWGADLRGKGDWQAGDLAEFYAFAPSDAALTRRIARLRCSGESFAREDDR